MNIKVSGQASVLWAKKRAENGRHAWLPVIVHLIDTQNSINWLFNHWLSRGQRDLLIGASTEQETQKLVKFLGFIHDVGKATAAFQIKESYDRDEILDDQLKSQLSSGGFLNLDELFLVSPNKSPHAIAGEAIIESLGIPVSVGAIIGGHHGKPAVEPPRGQIRDYTANYFQSDNETECQEPWKHVQQELLSCGLRTSGYQTVEDVPVITQPQAVLLEGLLIMSDWLASSEYLFDRAKKVPLFPLINIDESWKDIDMNQRFRQAMMAWDFGGEWMPEKITVEDPYKLRWGFEARPVQSAITKEISKVTDPGIIIIEAPMGIGKTEIALVAVEQLAYISGMDGVFMGLPTQATTNAMFGRVEEWLRFLAQTQNDNFQIKLMHGRSQFNQKYRCLPSAANVYDNDESGEIVVNSWFSGKKSILTKFTVGTIDNLLLMGLKQKHLFLRHLGFSGKVVIIDEVHAYDSYMNQYLYKAINWLGAYHVPIVILSATLPTEKRNSLLRAYLRGKYGRQYRKEVNARAGWEESQAYPLLSIVDGRQIKQVSEFPGRSDQKEMKIQVHRLNLSDEELIKDVVNKIRDGGIAGVIVNTVKRAQSLAKLVPKDLKLMLLHSAFLATDRINQETELQKAVGKKGHRPERMIVIGTQVLEQSLDIDFDVLYTDIAPMDLILQRAGRLHRHQIKRSEALIQPQLFIMGIEESDEYGKGNEAVYSKYLLMKTDHFLQETITLPDDISLLVQRVYEIGSDQDVLGINLARANYDVELERQRKKAKVFQIDSPKLKVGATIHNWLGRGLGKVDQDEQKAGAAVRDIKETLEVILVQHTSKGNYWLDGRQLSCVNPQEIAQQLIRIPSVVTPTSGQVDQAIKELETLTSQYFSSWQDNIWLKGALSLPLDENLSIVFEGWRLAYSSDLGLKYEKDDERGQQKL